MLTSHDETEDIPVLVVGGGPAGLAAAIELARRDVPALLVDRRQVLSSHPRATLLSLRSMELVRAWGLEAEVRARSADVDARMLESETLAHAGAGTPILVGVPSAEQSRVLSPTAPACVAQDDVEPLLLGRLRASSVRVLLGTELTAVVAERDGVLAQLRDVRTGACRTVHAAYVVAADGARSAIRQALGVPLVGPETLMEGVTTLFRAPLWDVVGEHRHLLYSVTSAEAPGVFLPTGASDRWLYGSPMDVAERPDDQRIARLIRLGAGVADMPVRIESTRRFSSGAQIAQCWRLGNVLLAGDAAHRLTPRGGMGLNIALHDGYDLGWKLGWVLRGWAAPALLDTYEAERRPVVEHGVARSADPSGSRRSAEQEIHADLGGRIAHAWSGTDSTLDLLGTGLTLFAGSDEAAREAEAAGAGSRAPIMVRILDPVAAGAVGAVGRSAMLVRPDGRPAGVRFPHDGYPGGRGGSRSPRPLRAHGAHS